MKPIKRIKEDNVIFTDEINSNHIVVMIVKDRKPAILYKVEGENDYRFLSVPSLLIGEFFGTKHKELSSIIHTYVSHGNCKVEIFEKDDWKQALQWLIDNTP